MKRQYKELIFNVFMRSCNFSRGVTESRTTFVSYVFFYISCIMLLSGMIIFFAAEDEGLFEIVMTFDWRFWCVLACAVLLFLPFPALIYRRLMDLEIRNWWLFMILLTIPLLGLWPFAVLCFRKGTKR